MVDEDQRNQTRRTSDELPKNCQYAMTVGIEEGIIRGFDRVFNDPERCRKFWQSGFDVMFDHSRENTSKWIGSRILTWLATVIAIGLLGWLAKNGVLTK